MATDGANNLRVESWPPVNPWKLVLAGLATAVVALALQMVQGWTSADRVASVLVPLRGFAILTSLILGGSAVSLRLRTASWEFEERVVSASLTGLAAFTALLGWLALDREAWDSIALFLGVVAFVGFVACALILLPRGVRRVVALLLVVFHFGGIFAAITTTSIPGTLPPWISQVVWTYVYRPYLQFAYLNNAYHFYSPEPGPAQQLWFYIKFEDGGGGEWLKIPQREDYTTRQEYQRILSVTENANYMEPRRPIDSVFGQMYQQRVNAGKLYHPSIKEPGETVTSEVTPPAYQYREPTGLSKRFIRSYAIHVASTYQSDAHPGAKVESVKVYRVLHAIVPSPLMAHGWSPDDPTFFHPFYQGEFKPNGDMIVPQAEFDLQGNMTKPGDPFLYWEIPIQYERKPGAKARKLGPDLLDQWNPEDFEIVDYCKLHAEGRANK